MKPDSQSAWTEDRGSVRDEDRPSKIHVTVIIQNRYAFDPEVVTGKQIKEKASIPAGFSLQRGAKGGNDAADKPRANMPTPMETSTAKGGIRRILSRIESSAPMSEA